MTSALPAVDASRSRAPWWLLVGVASLAGLAFWPAGEVGFFFDDVPSIPDNEGIATGDWHRAAFGPVHSPIAGRPLVCASFVLDGALWGLCALPMRIENVLLHVVNALLVLHVVLGALRGKNLAATFAPDRALRIAAAVALLWAVHPLATDAVAYVTQRTTLLAATCFLVALVALQRTRSGSRAAVAVLLLATAAGMACKEELVAAPILFLLHERAFEQPSWRAALARWPLFAGVAAAAWAVLLFCVVNAPHNSTVGYDTSPRCSAIEWLQTQTVPVLGYLQKTLWPSGLVGYSDWPIQRELGPVLWPGLAVVGLLVATGFALRSRPSVGFCLAAFFLLLAPTSSVLPIVTELVAERRAYLPSVAVLAVALVALDFALRRAFGCEKPIVFAVVAAALAFACVPHTRARVAAYTNSSSYWQDAYERNALVNRSFQAGMVLSNQGLEKKKRGLIDESMELFRRALECTATTPIEKLHYAMALAERGNHTMAEPLLRALAVEAPDFAEGRGTLATYLVESVVREPRAVDGVDPRIVEATEHARAAVRLAPQRAANWNTLAWLCQQQGLAQEAESSVRRAIELEPLRPEPHVLLGDLLLAAGRVDEARRHMGDLLANHPKDVDLRLGLAGQMFLRRDLEAVRRLLDDAMRIAPADLRVHQSIARLRAAQSAVGGTGR